MNYDRLKNLKNIKQRLFRVLEKSNKPLNYKQITKKLKFKDKHFILDLLENLVRIKKIEVNEKFKFFIKNKNEKTLSGYVICQKKSIFFQPNDSKDLIFLEKPKQQFFFDKDYINANVYAKNGEKRAKFNNIIERTNREFVGVVERSAKHCFVVPLDKGIKKDFYIDEKNSLKAKDRDKVIFKLIDWPPGAKSPFGKIISILGEENNFDVEKKAILHKYDIVSDFNTNSLKELKKINDKISTTEIKKRKDLRKVDTFTIDPDDAKDFDDAISIKKLENESYEVGVHIADVTHYIKENSCLDTEAYQRGCSVYLEDKVIPMIPEKLSNKICSLRPNEDKLCYSVLFNISKDGKVNNSWIGKTIINSKYRLTYQEAENIISGEAHKIDNEINILNSLAQIFRKKRIQEGSVIIKPEEIKIKFNKIGEPKKVIRKKILFSNQLVEEFMLLANKEVCKYFKKNNQAIYRVHDSPNIEKLKSLYLFLKKKNIHFNLSSKKLSNEINSIIQTCEEDPDFEMINQMVLRSMSKAKYTTENIGHFGLGFKRYSHFTSPIRRYSDMVTHRCLENIIKKDYDLEKSCIHISKKEKNAIQAERDYKNYLLLWMAKDKVNTVCKGKISSVKDWGLYVKLNEFLCEGLVSISSLKRSGRYYYDAQKEKIINKKTGNYYEISQEVDVKIEKINLNYGEMDLIIV